MMQYPPDMVVGPLGLKVRSCWTKSQGDDPKVKAVPDLLKRREDIILRLGIARLPRINQADQRNMCLLLILGVLQNHPTITAGGQKALPERRAHATIHTEVKVTILLSNQVKGLTKEVNQERRDKSGKLKVQTIMKCCDFDV
mmetsp:Transcript_40842/g.41546  ORF Transcript_40842/g.41546 Transcript_40842/m.41546 type:complete len:142 (-) Transcript_40842:286-711(-)